MTLAWRFVSRVGGLIEFTYRSVANLFPRKLATSSLGHDDLTLAIKAHDLHTHRARSSTLNLVLVAEQVDTGLSLSLIHI